jgi:hypothetical protein
MTKMATLCTKHNKRRKSKKTTLRPRSSYSQAVSNSFIRSPCKRSARTRRKASMNTTMKSSRSTCCTDKMKAKKDRMMTSTVRKIRRAIWAGVHISSGKNIRSKSGEQVSL